jgi:hypothetical protein
MNYLSDTEILELQADLEDALRAKKILQNESPQVKHYNESFFNEMNKLRVELDQLKMVA